MSDVLMQRKRGDQSATGLNKHFRFLSFLIINYNPKQRNKKRLEEGMV